MSGEDVLDTRGSLCPQPILDLAKRLSQVPVGTVVCVVSDDAAFPFDLEAWCAGHRHEFLGCTTQGHDHTGHVKKSHE